MLQHHDAAKRRLQYFRNGVPISIEDALDETGALRNGVSMRVPMSFRDSVSRDRRARIHDGSGDDCSPAALRRPGWRMADNNTRDAGEEARQQMILDAANAWRHPPQQHYTSDSNQERDPYSVIAADEEMSPMLRWKDSISTNVADAREHHRIVTDEAIDAYTNEISNAWKHGK